MYIYLKYYSWNMGRLFEYSIVLLIFIVLSSCSGNLSQTLLFEDGFSQLQPGIISNASGKDSEYFYLQQAGQKGNWTVTSYGIEAEYSSAWEIVEEGDDFFLRQNFRNLSDSKLPLNRHFHPAITGGDSIWTNYSVRFTFSPIDMMDKCGIMFRYQDDRSYYFFGMEGNRLMLKAVQQATAPYRPFEKVLASRSFNWKTGAEYEGVLTLRDNRIYAQINDSINLVATDDTYRKGKIGLLSDGKAEFSLLEVTTLKSEKRKINRRKREIANQLSMRLDENPKAVLLKSFSVEGFGTPSLLRFGELNGDGELEMIVCQAASGRQDPEIACITAISNEGRILWQYGTPQSTNEKLFPDLPIQIHDLEGDGSKEVIFVSGNFIQILNGGSGQRIRKIPIPEMSGRNELCKGLSNYLFFCDLQGKGRDSDLLFVDKSGRAFAFDERSRLLWNVQLGNVSYPDAADIDNDGKDEIALGYALLDDDGSIIWNLENEIKTGANVVLMTSLNPSVDSSLKIIYGAGEWGTVIIDLRGNVLKHHPVGNVHSITIANFRKDLPGLEMISSNFWGSQGIINFYNSRGNIYKSIEPGPFTSMCLPVNWKGDGEEYFLLNSSSGDGGLYNGFGQLVVVFPDDAHPVLCNTVEDVSGDYRDELITWDQHEIWIYTQSDNPRKGEMSRPERTPMYNSFVNQGKVSIPARD